VSLHPLTFFVVDDAGNVIEDALLELEGDPDVFDDETGTGLIDPASRLTDDEGVFDCWALPGVYRWRSTAEGVSSQWRYVQLTADGVQGEKGDPGEKGDKGDKGDTGAPGATTGDVHYDHVQGTAEEVWHITHNLGKYPSVTVLDSAGSEVEGQVDHIDTNSLTVTFTGAMSGNASLN
jgi:hypothetical protein